MIHANFLKDLYPEESSIPDRWNLSEPIIQEEYLFGGKLVKWAGAVQEVFSPVLIKGPSGLNPRLIGSYPLLTHKEAEEILKSACEAYDHGRGKWPTMSLETRIEHMQTFIDKMKNVRDEVVRLLMWEIGKTLPDSEKEFDRTIDYIKDTVSALVDMDKSSSRFIREQGVMAQIRRAPLGVVLCMGPFNYPLNETFTTLIPALLMGNAVIFKPPKLGVLLHRPLLKAFQESFPAGVVNTIYGEGQEVISPLMTSGKIDALAFIGSSRIANILQKQHPKPHRMRSILGLEAKNVSIVMKDADLNHAVREHVLGTLSYNGQRCTALKILFIHKDVVQDFLDRFVAEIDRIKCGMPWDEGVFITPLPESNKTEYLTGLVEDAVGKGARVVNNNGGTVNGTVFYPAVLYPVSSEMKVYHEEQFGPVIPVVPYTDIEEPVRYLIESNYGQQASIFGACPDKIGKLIDPLVNQVCRVNVNCQCQRGPDTFPFTGRKDSAEATLSVTDALKAFSIRTMVASKEVEENIKILEAIASEDKSHFLSV